MSVEKHKLSPECQRDHATEHIIAKSNRSALSRTDRARLEKYCNHSVLTLHHVCEPSLEFLRSWGELSDLRIYGCQIADCTALSTLASLKHLHYHTNRSKTPDLSFLSDLTPLKTLSIGYVTHLTALPDLASCRRLERLSIFQCNKLSDIEALLHIPKLQSVAICGTPLTPADLEPLMALPNLRSISAAFGQVESDKLFHELRAKYELELATSSLV